jgi:nicotinate-nucleotide pyrophosphorylase (carboxylating)
VFSIPDSASIVALALAEDLGVPPERFLRGAKPSPDLLQRDATSASVLSASAMFSGVISSRQDAVVAGLSIVAEVFDTISAAAGLAEPIEVFPLVAEGARVSAGTAVLEIRGPALPVLVAERTALDFLMLLSGIATETARWVEIADGRVAVCDTRKTSPGLRALSKYAVAVGGGTNHREGLFDMILIKDNHIRAAGGISAAVAKARSMHPDLLIEVEADVVDQAVEAVTAGADLVLLDNFDDVALASVVPLLREAASTRGRDVLLEASGGITRDRLAAVAEAGVDRVSTSALTLGVPVVDYGFDERSSGRS